MNLLRSTIFKIIVMCICIAITAYTLSRYALLVQHLLSIRYNSQFELLIVIGMLLFQYPFIYKNSTLLKLEYYLNMLLVSVFGSFLLWPLLIINHFYNCSDAANLIYFLVVVAVMFFEHKRRVTKLLLPRFISYTWVLYRFIILIFIL